MLGQNPNPIRILHAPPVRGARELLCKTDEATVSRMLSPKRYAGMVERLQKPVATQQLMEMAFSLTFARDSGEGTFDIPPDAPANFIFRFLALRLARSVHPENFMNACELRISRRSGEVVAAMYSDFVPDETGVMARRAEYSRRFYSSIDAAERKAIRLESDAAEHASNPALANCMRIMELSGIFVPHPEANYHIAGGKTVFFEVLGLDVRKAFSAAIEFSPDRDESLALISMICAVMFNQYNRMIPERAISLGRHFGFFGFEDTSRIIFTILSEAARKCPCVGQADRLGLFSELQSSIPYVYAMSNVLSWASDTGEPGKGWPVAVGPGII